MYNTGLKCNQVCDSLVPQSSNGFNELVAFDDYITNPPENLGVLPKCLTGTFPLMNYDSKPKDGKVNDDGPCNGKFPDGVTQLPLYQYVVPGATSGDPLQCKSCRNVPSDCPVGDVKLCPGGLFNGFSGPIVLYNKDSDNSANYKQDGTSGEFDALPTYGYISARGVNAFKSYRYEQYDISSSHYYTIRGVESEYPMWTANAVYDPRCCGGFGDASSVAGTPFVGPIGYLGLHKDCILRADVDENGDINYPNLERTAGDGVQKWRKHLTCCSAVVSWCTETICTNEDKQKVSIKETWFPWASDLYTSTCKQPDSGYTRAICAASGNANDNPNEGPIEKIQKREGQSVYWVGVPADSYTSSSEGPKQPCDEADETSYFPYPKDGNTGLPTKYLSQKQLYLLQTQFQTMARRQGPNKECNSQLPTSS
eukprot:Nk52_evm20s317 gene=Nk52_evmTU20s317